MKKNETLISLIVLISMLISCQPPVVFSSPQPEGVTAILVVPESYRGIYWCNTDSVNLKVSDNTIYLSKPFDVILTQQEIDSTNELTYNDGRLFIGSGQESFPATQKNDTIYSKVVLKDTLFSSQKPTHVLKNYKGHLVVNNKIGEATWEVKIITKSENGYLKISKVDYPESIAELDTLTSIKIIEDKYREQIIVSPTKAEFDQLLDHKIIFGSSCQEFEPIKAIDYNN